MLHVGPSLGVFPWNYQDKFLPCTRIPYSSAPAFLMHEKNPLIFTNNKNLQTLHYGNCEGHYCKEYKDKKCSSSSWFSSFKTFMKRPGLWQLRVNGLE